MMDFIVATFMNWYEQEYGPDGDLIMWWVVIWDVDMGNRCRGYEAVKKSALVRNLFWTLSVLIVTFDQLSVLCDNHS